MRSAAFAVIFAVCMAPGLAGAADIDLTGKVLHIDNQRGRLSMYLMEAGRFSTVNGNGPAGSGTWRVTDGKLCATYTEPKPPPQLQQEHCMPIAGRRVGDSWTEVASRSGPIRYTLADAVAVNPNRLRSVL